MGWCLFLLAVATVYGCVTCQSYGSPEDVEMPYGTEDASDMNDISYQYRKGKILSKNSCKDQNCGGYVEPDGVTIEPVNEDYDYEPQYPDPQHPTTDKTPVGKSGICERIKKAAEIIDAKHPDIASVQFTVLKELIKFTVHISTVLESESCHPTVKLLDFIGLAVEKLKYDYNRLTDDTCIYGETPATEETTEIYTSSDYEQVSEESHPGVTTHESVTSEETSKKPCPDGTEYPQTPTSESWSKVPEKPCPETSTYEASVSKKPCPEKPSKECTQTEEIIAEDDYDDIYPPFVGSIRGIPGEHYPNYTDIPLTSFSCADKYIPGFYADLETGCQVFHVCYKHRRESFLCPLGTIFNQPILACDYWYSSNCSLAPNYYEANAKTDEISKSEETDTAVGELVTSTIEADATQEYHEDTKLTEGALDDIAKFLPVKVKVVEEIPVSTKTKIARTEKPVVEEVASEIFDKIVSTSTRVVSKTRDIIEGKPKPVEEEFNVRVKMPVGLEPKIIKSYIPFAAKTKLTAAKKVKLPAVIPIAKVVAAKAAVPIIAKAKLVAAVPVAKMAVAKAAVPIIAKAKLAAAVPVAKVVAAKAAVPVIAKAKLAAAVPVAKVVAAKAAVPVIAKAKLAAAVPVAKVMAAKAAVPIVAKAKIAAVPVAKVVAAKAATPIVAKAKVVAAVPVVAKSKIVAGKMITSKIAIPIAAKAKVAAVVPIAKAAAVKTVPIIAKAKFAAAVPKIAVKGPVLKTKILAASLPFAKSAILKSTIPISKAKIVAAPVLKAKMFKTAAVPVVKGKLLALPLAKTKFASSVPLVKAKLFKAAAISPLTKKALALGYMKLLKAKKLALMG